MGIVQLFENFSKWALDAIPSLIKANATSRDEIIEVVSDLAAELQDGLNLASIYLRGARNIDNVGELGTYVAQAENALFKYHSEFKICKGLRKLRDRFNRIFDLLPHSITVGQRDEVNNLLREMELDERLIMDELRDLWPPLQQAATGNDPVAAVRSTINQQLQAVTAKRDKIGKIANKIIVSI